MYLLPNTLRSPFSDQILNTWLGSADLNQHFTTTPSPLQGILLIDLRLHPLTSLTDDGGDG